MSRFKPRRRTGSRATSFVAWISAFLLFGAGTLSSGQPPQRVFSGRVLTALRTNDPKYLERHFPNVQDFLDVMPGKFMEKVSNDEAGISRHLEERRDRFRQSMMFIRFESMAEPAFEWEYARVVKTDRRPKPNPRFTAGVESFDMFLTFSSGERTLHIAVYDCVERNDRIVTFGDITIVSAEEIEKPPEPIPSVARSVENDFEDAIADFERVEGREGERDRGLQRALEAIYRRAEEYTRTVKTRSRGQGNLEVFLLDLYAPATQLLRRARWFSEDERGRFLLEVDRQRLVRTEAVAGDRAARGEEADAGDLLEIVRWTVDPKEVAWRQSIDGKIIQYREQAVEKILSEMLARGRTQLEEGKLLDAIATLGNARQGKIPPGYDARSLHKRAPTRLEEIVSKWSLQADPLLEEAVRGYFEQRPASSFRELYGEIVAILSDRDLLAEASKPQALSLIEPLEERWDSEPETFEDARVRVETIDKDLRWPLPVAAYARLRRLRDIAARPSLLEFRYLIAQGKSFEALEFARARAPVMSGAEAVRLEDQIVEDLEAKAAEHPAHEALAILYRTIADGLRDQEPVALTDYFLKLGGPAPFTSAPEPSELEFSFRVRVSGCPALAESLRRGFPVSSGARRAELDIELECPEAPPERSTSTREVEEWVTETVDVPVYDVREVVDGYYEDCQTKYRYVSYRCRYYTYDSQGNIQESESGTGNPYCGSDIIPYEECEQKPLVIEERVFTGYEQQTRTVKKTRLVSDQWRRFRADLQVEITGRTENASVTFRHKDFVTTEWMEDPDDRDREWALSRAWDTHTPRLVREIKGLTLDRLRSSEAEALSEIRRREYAARVDSWRSRSTAMADSALSASRVAPDSLSTADLLFKAAVMRGLWPEEDSAMRVSRATGIPENQLRKLVPLWKLMR